MDPVSCLWECEWLSYWENSMVALQKIKSGIIILSNNPLLGKYPTKWDLGVRLACSSSQHHVCQDQEVEAIQIFPKDA